MRRFYYLILTVTILLVILLIIYKVAIYRAAESQRKSIKELRKIPENERVEILEDMLTFILVRF